MTLSQDPWLFAGPDAGHWKLDGRAGIEQWADAGSDPGPVGRAPAGNADVGDQYSTLKLTASATDSDPGATVTFSIAPGGPGGPTIGPARGIFSWTIPSSQGVPGIYPVTIDATDNSIPTQSATTSFTIDVQQQTNMTAVSGIAAQVGAGVLTATLQSTTTSGSIVSLAGQTVAFSVNDNGAVTPLGTAITNLEGIASLGISSVAGVSAGPLSGAIEATFAGKIVFLFVFDPTGFGLIIAAIVGLPAPYGPFQEKAKSWLQEVNIPVWIRKLVLSQERLRRVLQDERPKIATLIRQELAKDTSLSETLIERMRSEFKTIVEEAARDASQLIFLTHPCA
jgi:Putative Ig domain